MEEVPQVLPNSRIASTATRMIALPAPLRFWHLASLDAPTVALAWSAAFAWAAHVRLPLWVPILLALTVWSVYIADRLLDARTALRCAEFHRLRERHYFHHRHRRVLLPLAIVAATAAACIVFTLMPPIARERNSILAAASLVYFTRVHSGRGLAPLLPKFLMPKIVPKEFLVGLLFAAGCALPALSRIPIHVSAGAAQHAHSLFYPLLIDAAIFALLAWLNCHAIDRWESDLNVQFEHGFFSPSGATFKRKVAGSDLATGSVLKSTAAVAKADSAVKGAGFSPHSQPTNRVPALVSERNLANPSRNRIFSSSALLAATSLLFAALLFSTQPRSAALLASAAASAFLLALLNRLRARLTPIALRTAADLVLLVPAFLLVLK
jgi:hypothetical protein